MRAMPFVSKAKYIVSETKPSAARRAELAPRDPLALRPEAPDDPQQTPGDA